MNCYLNILEQCKPAGLNLSQHVPEHCAVVRCFVWFISAVSSFNVAADRCVTGILRSSRTEDDMVYSSCHVSTSGRCFTLSTPPGCKTDSLVSTTTYNDFILCLWFYIIAIIWENQLDNEWLLKNCNSPPKATCFSTGESCAADPSFTSSFLFISQNRP